MTAPPSTSAGTAANPSVSTITSIRIAVGSMNGAKLRSVQMAADKLLGQNGSVRVEVAGCNVCEREYAMRSLVS